MDGQCRGTTRSGERCKNTRTVIDGYCHLHASQKPERNDATSDSTGSISTPPVSKAADSTEVPEVKKFPWLLSGILFAMVLLIAGVIQTITGQKKAIKRRCTWRF